MLSNKVTIGIAFSGGGAKGVCHLGMLEALNEKGFHYDVLSGASAGSLVGALTAYGLSPRAILEICKSTDFSKLVGLAFSWRGLLKINKAIGFLKEHLPETFEELHKPMIVACTSMDQNKIVYFHEGPLLEVLVASCRIPVVFEPVEINGEQFVDGGVLDNLPIRPLKDREVDYVIGLHCNSAGAGHKAKGWKELMFRSLEMAISAATIEKSRRVNLYMEAPDMSRYEVFDFKKAQEMYDVGYQYASRFLENVKLPKKGLLDVVLNRKIKIEKQEELL